MPNASFLNNPVMNYSVNPLRRLEIKIGIAYNEDLNKTIDLLREMLSNEEKIDKTQSITVEVSDFEEYRINLAVRAFTKREDYWDVYYKLHKKTIELRSEEHTSELQSRGHIVCRLLLEKKKSIITVTYL